MSLKPITRKEKFMAKAGGQDVGSLTPVTREEMFLAKAGGQDVETPTPVTRQEMFLADIANKGGGEANLGRKQIDFNGVYSVVNTTDNPEGYDGWDEIGVNVIPEVRSTPLYVTENGTYSPSDSSYQVDYFDVVNVDVPTSESPNHTDADVSILHTDLGYISVSFPEGTYPNVYKSYEFDENLPLASDIRVGDKLQRVYFNQQYVYAYDSITAGMDEILRSLNYGPMDAGGVTLGSYHLIGGKTKEGAYVAVGCFDLSSLQSGLYAVLVGNLRTFTLVYATQDFDLTAAGLIAGKAGWNATEAEFPCTVDRVDSLYAMNLFGLVAKEPIYYGVKTNLPYWIAENSASVLIKLYFNQGWQQRDAGVQLLEPLFRQVDYEPHTHMLSGAKWGQCDLIQGETTSGDERVCALFDLTSVQDDLYALAVGNPANLNLTIIYATQDFDFADLGLSGTAGWNTAEADFPCKVTGTSELYRAECYSLVSTIPVHFGNPTQA